MAKVCVKGEKFCHDAEEHPWFALCTDEGRELFRFQIGGSAIKHNVKASDFAADLRRLADTLEAQDEKEGHSGFLDMLERLDKESREGDDDR